MALTFPGLCSKSRHVVTGNLQKMLITQRLLIRVNVLPLAVLDQLPFKGLFITDLDDPHRDLLNPGELRGTKAACSRNDFEALGVRSGNYGLYKTLSADALGKFVE